MCLTNYCTRSISSAHQTLSIDLQNILQMRQKPRFPSHGGTQWGREDLSRSAASSCVWPELHSTSPLFPLGPLWSLLHTWRLMGQLEGPPHMDNLVFPSSLPPLAMNPPSSCVSGHLQEQSPEVRQGEGVEEARVGGGVSGILQKG